MLTTVFVLWNVVTLPLRRVRKIAKSNCQLSHVCVCLSVFRTEQLGSHWAGFREISYLSIFRKFDRNNEPFT
jgi:hypothetical protein